MKEKFIKSTIILSVGGLLTKILGMVLRIVTTRIIGLDGISLYMMVMPTYTLFITIATLSLPIAISKLVSENTRNNKNVVLGIIPIAMIINVILVIILVFSSKFIAHDLLKNKSLYYPILGMAITLPFITLSNIIRGYFFGKQKMTPNVISNLFEQIIRIIMTIIITPYLLNISLISAVTGLILYNIASEMLSILILFLFIPKNIRITKKDISLNYENIKDTFKISIPTTGARIINSIGTFLEPIIITFVLLNIGYNTNFITLNYGIISGYVFPMVMMPQFLSGSISSALLPAISRYYALKDYKNIKNKMYLAIFISLTIGLVFTIIIMLAPEYTLKLLFNETSGSNYLFWAAPIFLITYIQGPILSTLQAINNADIIMKSSILGIIIKTVILFILLYLDIDMYALLISIFIQYMIVTIYQFIKLKRLFITV